jgi:hypothetical protein
MPKPKRLKQEEAAARQAAHEKLSLSQKLFKVYSRRGASKREVARLRIALPQGAKEHA